MAMRRVSRWLLWAALVAAGLAPTAPADEAPDAEAPAPAAPDTTSPVVTDDGGNEEAAPDKGAAEIDPDAPVTAAMVTIDGTIDKSLVTSVLRRAEDARADGRGLVIFHITSPGGFLEDGLDLTVELAKLGRRGVRTVAYIDSEAYSAAAMAAFACQAIVMAPEASVGACTPYSAGPSGPQDIPEEVQAKFEGVVIERLESLAARHGYPPALLKAMVKMSTVVVEVVNEETGETRYIEEQDLMGMGPEWKKDRIIVPGDEVLTVGAEKALAYGIASHIIGSRDELYGLYPIEGRIRTYAVTPSETAVLWLNNMYLKSLLALIGLLGIYVEITTPGFGVPGLVGIGAFALLFTASFLAGRPDYLPPLLFAIGLALLAVELFVTPGFGLLGGSGILVLMVGIVLALGNFEGLPERDFEYAELGRAIVATAAVLAVFLIAAGVLARLLPHVPVLGRLVLGPTSISDGSNRAAAARVERGIRVGDTGRTTTMLRPAGKARFGQRTVDVMTAGELLDRGTEVQVVEVRGNRVVVAPREGGTEPVT